MNININAWSEFMTGVAVLNICLILYVLTNVKTNFEMKLYILAFIFVLVNSIRSIWLRTDSTRICIFDTIMSSPLLGRTMTTISELAFVALIVLVFKQVVKRGNHDPVLDMMLNAILVIILIAEVFCWSGCLSTNTFWNMLEESSWTLSSIILTIVIVLVLRNEKNKTIKRLLYIGIVATIIYEIFMIKVDVPMYAKRANNPDKEVQKMTLFEKIMDMFKCKRISNSNKDWNQEIPWMTGYFTMGSWLTIALVNWYTNNRRLFKS